jgi:cell division protein FtsI (penicillin-binding protein 3)
VNEIHQSGLSIQQNEPEIVQDRICSEKTLRLLKDCLEGVMVEGTGKELNNPYYKIAGKTGTALVANGRHGYADHIYQSSFAGYFPADNPQYSCIVLIKNKPFAKKFYGAMVAGPVFKEIADKLVSLNSEKINSTYNSSINLNSKADSNLFYYAGFTSSIRQILRSMNMNFQDSTGKIEWSRIYSGHEQTVMNKEIISRQAVPNVKGMGLKDALFLLENMNLKVAIRGKGKVVNQSIEPGTAFQKNQRITLELN